VHLLFTGESDVASVNDNDPIPVVDGGRVDGLVLSAEGDGDTLGEFTEDLFAGIDEVPDFGHGEPGFSDSKGHGKDRLFLKKRIQSQVESIEMEFVNQFLASPEDADMDAFQDHCLKLDVNLATGATDSQLDPTIFFSLLNHFEHLSESTIDAIISIIQKLVINITLAEGKNSFLTFE
jgi:hypothetical protein